MEKNLKPSYRAVLTLVGWRAGGAPVFFFLTAITVGNRGIAMDTETKKDAVRPRMDGIRRVSGRGMEDSRAQTKTRDLRSDGLCGVGGWGGAHKLYDGLDHVQDDGRRV